MTSNEFRSFIQNAIKEQFAPKETITRSQLKEIVKAAVRSILLEMNGRLKEIEGDEEAFYKDAQGREEEYARARQDLDVIKQAGLGDQYERLMNGIFKLPIAEFDKRAAAIQALTQKAYQMVGRPMQEITTTSAVAPINLPGNVRGGWVSGKGGSKRGVEGSPSGMTLTPMGRYDMQRKQDPV